MTVEVAPNKIELSSFMGGYAPDPEEGSLPLDSTPDVLNLLPDVNSGAMEVRKGFTRLSAGRVSSLEASHYIRHLNYYEVIDGGTRKRYLVAIMSDGQDATMNNIQVWVYDLLNDTFTRVDDVDRSWAKAKTEHWYAIVEGTYYGGTRGEVMYSWHPTNGWNADPTTPAVDSWVNVKGNSVAASGEKAKDYAFKKGQKVEYNSKYYSTLKGIRYDTWEDGEHYSKGKRVSRKVDHGTRTYWRSFECIVAHDSTTSNRPGDGTGTPTKYWKNIRLKNIKDEDNEITADWTYMALPGKSSVGTYHGFRVWVRHDDSDNWGRVQYSAPAKPEKDSIISDLDWRPTDWAPVDDNEGDGGGWFTVPFGRGDAVRALWSYGQYLFILGRWESFVLSGTNEQSWTLRPLGKVGAIGPQCVVEHDGLVYFWSPEGTLNVSDGTSWQEVPGIEKVREFIKSRTDKLMLNESTYNWHPSLQSFGAFLWMALPDPSGGDNKTLVYHPKSQSFWLLDIPALDYTIGEKGRTQNLWFSTAITAGAGQSPTVFQYKDDPGSETWTDDDWEGGAATATDDISYYWRSGWFMFGMTRAQRRLRRAWMLLKGETAHVATIDMLKDYDYANVLTTADRTLVGEGGDAGSKEAEFIEAKVGQANTGHAFGVEIFGDVNAQFAINGVGIDTEPVRTRFKRD